MRPAMATDSKPNPYVLGFSIGVGLAPAILVWTPVIQAPNCPQANMWIGGQNHPIQWGRVDREKTSGPHFDAA